MLLAAINDLNGVGKPASPLVVTSGSDPSSAAEPSSHQLSFF
jgi:hypothetical protein